MAKRRGFTLAETLVALMVFSMALSLLGVAATNLKTGGLRVIRCQVFTMAPISFALYNKETMRRRNVVFQLGGGTFHVDP
ncbi:prepilin-type N-terminal cleavage/methylation domain-containing protein [Weissella confusa]|uniref:Prepilin-type N-terminal cleavage/methylation domain-containing protein n=1 Tax=Weissella confusa TaxID=1583 RepID=A0A923SNW2_WEICO|nr:prepilin-type N-terminal cleavage/methylation domain-containing protein [Weissella confusa]